MSVVKREDLWYYYYYYYYYYYFNVWNEGACLPNLPNKIAHSGVSYDDTVRHLATQRRLINGYITP